MSPLAIVLAAVLARQPPAVTTADFHSGRYDGQEVRIDATVVDAFNDEHDPDYVFLVLKNSGGYIYSFIYRQNLDISPNKLVGAEISAIGIVKGYDPYRPQAQRFFNIPRRKSLVVSRPAPNPFDAPDLSTVGQCRPEELAIQGRKTLCGTVVAVWNEGRSVLVASSNGISHVSLSLVKPPAVHDRIIAAGFPETDLRELNLSRSVWKPRPDIPETILAGPTNVSLKAMMTDSRKRRAINHLFHGKRVRFTACVRSEFDSRHAGQFVCGDGEHRLTVDVSALNGSLPDIGPGDTVEVEGVALCDVDNCRPSEAFPQARGYIVVPAAPGDVVVVARSRTPLPHSIWYAFFVLVAAIFGIGLWNWSLRRIAFRRGRELANAEIAQAEADLRLLERTRLAVELHDSLAQNLTGVALEIETSQRLWQNAEPRLREHLERAGQALASCRDELRNCLWDLRSEALEESDMNEAIRRTLLPKTGSVKLTVRFNVPRERISDNTAHMLLRMIRELTANAIRHGGATHVQIAGATDGGSLFVSVSDNGCGFDPAAAPGVMEGHFGLEGIRERVNRLGGEFSIESAAGAGTRATAKIPIPAQTAP